jgi:hypothetical protein
MTLAEICTFDGNMCGSLKNTTPSEPVQSKHDGSFSTNMYALLCYRTVDWPKPLLESATDDLPGHSMRCPGSSGYLHVGTEAVLPRHPCIHLMFCSACCSPRYPTGGILAPVIGAWGPDAGRPCLRIDSSSPRPFSVCTCTIHPGTAALMHCLFQLHILHWKPYIQASCTIPS